MGSKASTERPRTFSHSDASSSSAANNSGSTSGTGHDHHHHGIFSVDIVGDFCTKSLVSSLKIHWLAHS